MMRCSDIISDIIAGFKIWTIMVSSKVSASVFNRQKKKAMCHRSV